MSIKDALKPFRKRLMIEALIRSAVLAGMIAACIASALGIVHVIIPWLLSEFGIILFFTGLFALVFGLLFAFLYRPSKRQTAKRIDGLGLSERVETMLEFEHSTTPAARLQREDTLARLQHIKAQDLRLRISRTVSVLCAVFCICATVLLLVPEINAFSRYPIVNELNQMVQDSHISDEFREDLEEIIQDLEEKLDSSTSDEDREQAINDAKEQIDDSVKKENSKNQMGEALQGYDDLKELGEAIQKGDKEAVSSALDKLQEEMTGDPEKQESVADQLQNALEQSKVDPENDLYEALENMMNGLKNPDKPLGETMDKAESEINDALDKQQNAENLGEQMKDALENAKPSNPGDGSEGQEGAGQQGSQGQSGQSGQNGQQGNGSGEGSDGEGEVGVGGSGNGNTSMTDKVVDPKAGQVNFGEVYAAYVADFLTKVEAGELPDSVVESMNEYLEQLKNQNKGDNE